MSLPAQPLFSPAAKGAAYSTDRAVLEASLEALAPLVGGSAPVYNGLREAIALAAAEAPPGNAALVALLGGDDDAALDEPVRQAKLAALRQARDETGTQAVLVVGEGSAQHHDRTLAELSAALRAPVISLVEWPMWTKGSFAALDLAADLIDGEPLPTLSVAFRVKAMEPNAFPAGAVLRGVLSVESDICPMGCMEIPFSFVAEIP